MQLLANKINYLIQTFILKNKRQNFSNYLFVFITFIALKTYSQSIKSYY